MKSYKINITEEMIRDMIQLGYLWIFEIKFNDSIDAVSCPSIPTDWEDGCEIKFIIKRDVFKGIATIDWYKVNEA